MKAYWVQLYSLTAADRNHFLFTRFLLFGVFPDTKRQVAPHTRRQML